MFHGDTVPVVGQDKMQLVIVDKPTAGRDFSQLGCPYITEAKYDKLIGMCSRECLL